MANGTEPHNDDALKSQADFIQSNSKDIEAFLYMLPEIDFDEKLNLIESSQILSTSISTYSLYLIHKTAAEHRADLLHLEPGLKSLLDALADKIGGPPNIDQPENGAVRSCFSIWKQKFRRVGNLL
jgi:hypothetical protein